MKHCFIVVLFCLGLIFTRAPLSFNDIQTLAQGDDIGLIYGAECRCYGEAGTIYCVNDGHG